MFPVFQKKNWTRSILCKTKEEWGRGNEDNRCEAVAYRGSLCIDGRCHGLCSRSSDTVIMIRCVLFLLSINKSYRQKKSILLSVILVWHSVLYVRWVILLEEFVQTVLKKNGFFYYRWYSDGTLLFLVWYGSRQDCNHYHSSSFFMELVPAL